jgi:hypothetical protein
MPRESNPAIDRDEYFDEALEAFDLLHEKGSARRRFHGELMSACLNFSRKTFRKSDLDRLRKLFDAAAAE